LWGLWSDRNGAGGYAGHGCSGHSRDQRHGANAHYGWCVVDTTASRWLRIYGAASWILIVLFVFLAAAHVVLTVLFYTGVHDTGVGYIFDWQWPAWLIVIIDGTTAWLLWFAYRRCTERATLGLILTLAASIMALARASWMVFVPILLVIAIAGSVTRVTKSRPAPLST
jgi:hypothetical protein